LPFQLLAGPFKRTRVAPAGAAEFDEAHALISTGESPMPTGKLAYHFIARHGYAIERLKRDMAAELSREHLLGFLAYDAANYLYAFLLASGNAVSRTDRGLRDELEGAVLAVLARHGIDRSTFVVRPEIDADVPLPEPE
jgi:hypothetical protein